MSTAQWSSHTFISNGLSINYYHSLSNPGPNPNVTSPSALPILVILHALLGSGAAMIPIASKLLPSFEIFIPDARGHGHSQPIASGTFQRSWLVADAAAFIKHVTLEDAAGRRKVFLLGHSMGASTAARVAKLFPELIAALVLEEPPWRRGDGDAIDPSKRTLPRSLLDEVRALQNLSNAEFQKIDIHAANLPMLAESFKAATRAFDVEECAATFFACDDELNEAVANITVQTLLQFGDSETGSKLDPETKQKTFWTWPLGEFLHYPGGGHFLHVDHEAQWVKDVVDFLERSGGKVSQNVGIAVI